MKRALLLPLLLLTVAAAPAPANRPADAKAAAERVVVQVRHVEYRLDSKDPPRAEIPTEPTDVSSLQVAATVGGRFESVAVLSGTTYRLAGQLERLKGDNEHFRVKIDYSETSGGVAKNVTQINSTIMSKLDEPFPLSGMLGSGKRGVGLIVTLKHPVAATAAAQ